MAISATCFIFIWTIYFNNVFPINAFYSYGPSYRDILSRFQSYNFRRQNERDLGSDLYLRDLVSPYLSQEYAESNLLHKRSENDDVQACKERSGIKYTGLSTADVDVRFPAIHTKKDDSYMCTGYKVPFSGKESFIVSFTPHADMSQTHHMLVYGCHDMPKDRTYWQCGSPCENKITLYAWARNAPELSLPKYVGYSIGGHSGIKYIVVQMHFAKKFNDPSCSGVTAHVTTEPQKYYAGIYLLGVMNIQLPPHKYNIPASVACLNQVKQPMHVFAFRTHAHTLANVITGYRGRDGQFSMIGKGNPKWPQSFYPRVGGEIELDPGDLLAMRCVYNNTRDDYVFAGPTGEDEMCNLYLMFYSSDKSILKGNLECWDNPSGLNANMIPFPDTVNDPGPYPGYGGEDSEKAIADGTAEVPPVPEEHIHHHHGGGEDEEVEEEKEVVDNQEDHKEKKDPHLNVEDSELQEEYLHEVSELEANTSASLSRSHGMPESEGLRADLDWPHLDPKYSIGAVGGLAADENGDLHVFHRAGRIWGANSFDSHNRFTQPNNPIEEDVVYHIQKDSGKVLHAWGSGMFFMPHGLSLDSEGNMWLTDVAMHQVFKFPPGGSHQALLTLGERMVPGSDIDHFCKPTDVAVDDDGMIYISDGYCNGRVMKFNPDGSFVQKWGRMVTTKDMLHPPVPPGAFFVAHNIILCGPEHEELCVADRENGRIQCFTKNGMITRVIEDKKNMGKRIFAITYSPLEGGVIYGVNGPDRMGSDEVGGFTIHYRTGKFLERWEPSSNTLLTDPHDISASPSGKTVYVGDLTNKKVYKFDEIPSASKVAETGKNLPDLETENDENAENSEDNSEPVDKKSGMIVETPENKEKDEERPTEIARSTEKAHKQDEQEKSVSLKTEKEVPPPDSGAATAIIIILLVLPTMAILTAFVCVRIRARRLKEYEGLLSSSGSKSFGKKKSLNLGKLLQRSDKKGFTIVQSDDSDDEGMSDSDVEVYSKKDTKVEVEEETGAKE